MRRLVIGMLALGLLLGVPLGVLLGGCGRPAGDQTTAGAGPPPTVDDLVRLDEQARQALARWADAVAAHGDGPRFVPIDDGFGLVGDREPEIAANFKSAVMAGQLEAAPGVLPAGDPGTGEVRWDDGSTVTLPLRSAEAALHSLTEPRRDDCGGCTPLRVTGARLVTVTTRTDRGPATVPAWEFALAGTAARITKVAVAASAAITVSPPPWDGSHRPAGLWVESAEVAADGRTVTAHFTGGRAGTGPCTSDYTARAVESELAAVIIVEEHPHAAPHPAPATMACDLAGHPRTATLTLAAPLAQRTLLQVVDGKPIPTTR
jgi:hypothetical protein